jgi:hypothetical protein
MKKLNRIPKGTNKLFAAGGKQKMFGAGSRTKSAYPASLQKPGQTSQHAGNLPRRTGGKAADLAGTSGGSPGASHPRQPA